MSRVVHTAAGPEFRITHSEAMSADIRKLAGSKAPQGLKDLIDIWLKRNRDVRGKTPPTHQFKKAFPNWGIPVGTLVHIPKKRWVRTQWTCSDGTSQGDGVVFYKVRGHWFAPYMSLVNERGFAPYMSLVNERGFGPPLNQGPALGIFDSPGKEFRREFLKPYKDPLAMKGK